ncbi:MAG: hypothetical protein AB7I45_01295 [Planctomycetota bacterium]
MSDLRRLSDLLRRRNEVDAEIAALIDRPALPGHLGEWIAARVFDLELHPSAVHKGSDAVFRSGPLKGKTVNVKMYGYQESMLDVHETEPPDCYLVLTGPRRTVATSRGAVRPFVITAAYVFLHEGLLRDGVKPGIAASVRKHVWQAAMVWPEAGPGALIVVGQEQAGMLGLFR